MNFLAGIRCPKCHSAYSKGQLLTLCRCGSPLLVDYDLDAAGLQWKRESLARRAPTMWRYREVLPVEQAGRELSLGEGFTPILPVPRLGEQLGLANLFIKDESFNPTGSFKARGLSAAVSMARELGVRRLAIPSAGNAAGAMAAYAAHAGMESYIFMPDDTPRANVREAEVYGAHVTLVHGLITDCGKIVAERKEREGWFDVSTLKEPYRLEGKKTMGYELAEQSGWELPDVVLYPTGGGTGLIGMWKAFGEMERMGWIGPKRPRMVTVQASGCAPIVRAFHAGESAAEMWKDAHTVASGLRVPRAIGDFLILGALRESGGTAVDVDDAALMEGVRLAGRLEGVFLCPEGGACVAALEVLVRRGWVRPHERVVIFNTGTGLKYLEALECS